ncbi:hypothetical protein OHA98_42315 [Streptomyces sp. NBC_00654]|uniref:hypothetical protein n=1 Tax=Streptomyces sp. NBC_00654 TaxID=2975799 RepID=UPI00224D1A3E|nr:hypothetical protein [Streptomyces sp. NBC_00654]MCX4971235.1 hypothetical protein [Streptomyces sp. NBC_00654]MCX4971236.1 hypothetical protein [Streptomyces sp. NBC_00654]
MQQETVIAQRYWHTRARVRITLDYTAGAVDPDVQRHFTTGQELILIQWGIAGRPVGTQWWTSQDIDGAHIIPNNHVKVLEVIEHISPTE